MAHFFKQVRGGDTETASVVVQDESSTFGQDTPKMMLSVTVSAAEATEEAQKRALLLSVLAGLSTCLGAAVVFVGKPILPKHLSFSLALAGSVMVTVSLVSILPESFSTRVHDEEKWLEFGSPLFLERCVSLAIGCGLYSMLSKCAFPAPDSILGIQGDDTSDDKKKKEDLCKSETASDYEKDFYKTDDEKNDTSQIRSGAPSDDASRKDATTKTIKRKPSSSTLARAPLSASLSTTTQRNKPASGTFVLTSCYFSSWTRYISGADLGTIQARRNWRVAVLLFVSLAVHNFPEGLAVAASSMHSPRLGLTTSIAIALHNIPEGIAIAVPYLAARPNTPWAAFLLAGASGLTEPLGALVALLVLQQSESDNDDNPLTKTVLSMKNVLAFTAGIMIMAAVTELFPESLRHRRTEGIAPFLWGSILGALVMIGSEAVLANTGGLTADYS